MDGGFLQQSLSPEDYRRELSSLLEGLPPANDSTLMQVLRRFRQKHMLRIAWRDLAGAADTAETLTNLTDLAEACVNAVDETGKEIDVGGPEVLTHNQILAIAFESLGKPVKISRIPIWLRNVMLTTLRLLTSVKTYGPLEFFMTVLAMDMTAPTYGKYHLKDFFLENCRG